MIPQSSKASENDGLLVWVLVWDEKCEWKDLNLIPPMQIL